MSSLKTYILICSIEGDSANKAHVITIDGRATLAKIVGLVGEKWPSVCPGSAILKYQVPGNSCKNVDLDNDDDVRMMFLVCDSSNSNRIDVAISVSARSDILLSPKVPNGYNEKDKYILLQIILNSLSLSCGSLKSNILLCRSVVDSSSPLGKSIASKSLVKEVEVFRSSNVVSMRDTC